MSLAISSPALESSPPYLCATPLKESVRDVDISS